MFGKLEIFIEYYAEVFGAGSSENYLIVDNKVMGCERPERVKHYRYSFLGVYLKTPFGEPFHQCHVHLSLELNGCSFGIFVGS